MNRPMESMRRVLAVAHMYWLVATGMTTEPALASPKSEKEQDEITLPSEVITLLDASKTQYAITSPAELKDVSPDKYGETIWPQGKTYPGRRSPGRETEERHLESSSFPMVRSGCSMR